MQTWMRRQLPLLGVKPTWLGLVGMSANDRADIRGCYAAKFDVIIVKGPCIAHQVAQRVLDH